MATTMRKVVALLKDDTLGKPAKLARLRQMEADLRAKSRASTEGMPVPEAAEEAEALKAVLLALDRLGAPPLEPGAATL
jgi:hypothetical protein